jgi:hypothetical protein
MSHQKTSCSDQRQQAHASEYEITELSDVYVHRPSASRFLPTMKKPATWFPGCKAGTFVLHDRLFLRITR